MLNVSIQADEAPNEGVILNVAGSQRDGDGESGNAHPPQCTNNKKILESSQNCLCETKNVMSILLHNEGVVRQQKIEDDYNA